MPCKSIEVSFTAALKSRCSSNTNCASPLLHLSQEIKDQINGFIFGGHIIQIEQDDNICHGNSVIGVEQEPNLSHKDPDAIEGS